MRQLWCVLGWFACALLLAPAAAPIGRSRFATPRTTSGRSRSRPTRCMTCPDSAPTCASARLGLQGGTLGNNNGYAMTYVDVDGPGTTFNSSTATLSLPPDGFVLFAGLYWAGDTSAGSVGTVRGTAAPTPAARGTVLLRAAGGGRRTATGVGVHARHERDPFQRLRRRHRRGAPRRGRVPTRSPTSSRARAGTATGLGISSSPTATRPSRRATSRCSTAWPRSARARRSRSLSLSGFTTPPSGPVRSVVGLISSEGDRTSTGDSASLNSRPLFGRPQPAGQRLQLVDQPARRPLHGQGARLRQPAGLGRQFLRARTGIWPTARRAPRSG